MKVAIVNTRKTVEMNRNQALKRYKAIKAEFELFSGETEPDRIRLLENAWVTNLRRDGIERNAGYAAHSDVPLDLQLRTVITALWAAVSSIDRSTTEDAKTVIAEAIAMTQWVEAQLRPHSPKR